MTDSESSAHSLCCFLLSSRVLKPVGTFSFLFLGLLISVSNVFGTGAIPPSQVLLLTPPELSGGKTRAALLTAAWGRAEPKSGRFIADPRCLL